MGLLNDNRYFEFDKEFSWWPSIGHWVNNAAVAVHFHNRGWWGVDLPTDIPIERNMGELLMLAVSELSEAMEGHRKNLMDDKLPHRKMVEVEIADCIIRLLDMSAGFGFDIGGALIEKCKYNSTREDHSKEHRLSKHGKKY